MARDGQNAQELLRAWAEAPVPPDDAAAADLRRRRVVAATALTIARSSSARAKRERWLRVGVTFASAAAVLAVAGVGWRIRSRLHHPSEDATSSIAQVQLLAGSIHRSHPSLPLPTVAADGRLALGPGDEVTTEPTGRGEIVLTDGVAITVESRTHVRLPDVAASSALAQATEQVGLDAGSVFVRVPPLPAGHTFTVRTPDTLVTVHGTAFAVDVTQPPQGPTATRVRVSSGVVSVAPTGGREVFLTAGMEWSSPNSDAAARTAAAEPAKEAPIAVAAAPAPQAGVVRATSPRRGHAQARSGAKDAHDDGASSSTLGEENRLLASAIAQSRAGDFGGAVSTLDDLLRRFPVSPVAPEAHVQRFRALERGGDLAGAAREARTYLALYPEGSAREEAKRLAVEP
jgi:hypothetical protein